MERQNQDRHLSLPPPTSSPPQSTTSRQKGQQTIRYYGPYSNKSRDLPRPATSPAEPIGEKQPAPKPPIVPPPPKATARAMRPLWRDLILRVWGADPLQCPRCKAIMNVTDNLLPSQ